MMESVCRWSLWYADGTVITNEDLDRKNCSRWGLVCITQPDLKGADRFLNNGHAYFYRTDLGHWTTCENEVGLIDNLVHYVHVIDVVCFGRWHFPTEEYKQIATAANRTVNR